MRFGQQIGKRIVKARKARGWRQVDLAREADIPKSDLCRYELGRYSPRLPRLAKIAKALDVEIGDLLA